MELKNRVDYLSLDYGDIQTLITRANNVHSDRVLADGLMKINISLGDCSADFFNGIVSLASLKLLAEKLPDIIGELEK